jgi:hypothetical protein
MHRISGRPDIRPENLAFLYIRYPAGYQIALPDIRKAGYRISGVCLTDSIIYLTFL